MTLPRLWTTVFRTALAAATFGMTGVAEQPVFAGDEAEKARLLADYQRLLDTAPDQARKVRDAYAELANRPPAKPPLFGFMLGSQWMGGLSPDQELAAFLRDKSPLQEAHRMMTAIGSDIVKFAPTAANLVKQGQDADGKAPLDVAIAHPHYRAVLDMPFRVAVFWAHGGRDAWAANPMTDAQKKELHREMFALTAQLLTRYAGTGKTFLIGNWEGDWMAGGKSAGNDNDLAPERIAAFQEWLDVRTRAIDEAKAATPHEGVAVYSFLEVNHVNRARVSGVKRLVNTVLPRSRVDYVSVSSYEMQGYGRWPAPRTEATLRDRVFENLSFVEANLPPRDIAGKRVFVGEIGITLDEIQKKQKLTRQQADIEQARLALVLAKVDLEWGAPLWLWWAIYNSKDGAFSLVDQSTGRRSTLFKELETYYAWAAAFVQRHDDEHGGPPDQRTFQAAAIDQLGRQISRLERAARQR